MTTQDRERAPRPHREVHFERCLAAPRTLVYRTWTDPAMMANWWGPKDFTNPVCRVDARPGGDMFIVMRAPDGSEHPMKGLFHQVLENDRLAFTDSAVDRDGNVLLEGMTIATFEDHGQGTLLTVWSSAVGMADTAPEMLAGMDEGWSQSLDRLDHLLAN
jgi:uncharacterized protein YndB with AHSA1/START domain